MCPVMGWLPPSPLHPQSVCVVRLTQQHRGGRVYPEAQPKTAGHPCVLCSASGMFPSSVRQSRWFLSEMGTWANMVPLSCRVPHPAPSSPVILSLHRPAGSRVVCMHVYTCTSVCVCLCAHPSVHPPHRGFADLSPGSLVGGCCKCLRTDAAALHVPQPPGAGGSCCVAEHVTD